MDLAIAIESPLLSESLAFENELFVIGRAPDHTEPEYTRVQPQCVYYRENQSNALRFVCGVRIAETDGTVDWDGQRIYIKMLTMR